MEVQYLSILARTKHTPICYVIKAHVQMPSHPPFKNTLNLIPYITVCVSLPFRRHVKSSKCRDGATTKAQHPSSCYFRASTKHMALILRVKPVNFCLTMESNIALKTLGQYSSYVNYSKGWEVRKKGRYFAIRLKGERLIDSFYLLQWDILYNIFNNYFDFLCTGNKTFSRS